MPIRLTNVVVAANDPESLADFWNTELEMWNQWIPGPGEGNEWRLIPDEDDEGNLEVIFIPAPKPPKVGKNRVHLDLNTQDMREYQRRYDDQLRYTDIRPLDIGQGELVPWVVYPDPEGNEFCVLKPRDRYKQAGALAAIVFDSADPVRLAAFWSELTGWPIVDNQPEFAALRGSEEGPFVEFVHNEDRSPQPAPVSLGFESYWPHQHDADVQRLVDLGGQKVRTHQGEVSYTIVADPEGNEFRVVIPVWPPPPRR